MSLSKVLLYYNQQIELETLMLVSTVERQRQWGSKKTTKDSDDSDVYQSFLSHGRITRSSSFPIDQKLGYQGSP